MSVTDIIQQVKQIMSLSNCCFFLIEPGLGEDFVTLGKLGL